MQLEGFTVHRQNATITLSLYNSVKNNPILIIFGTQNPEDILHLFCLFYTCLPHPKMSQTLRNAVQNVLIDQSHTCQN